MENGIALEVVALTKDVIFLSVYLYQTSVKVIRDTRLISYISDDLCIRSICIYIKNIWSWALSFPIFYFITYR